MQPAPGGIAGGPGEVRFFTDEIGIHPDEHEGGPEENRRHPDAIAT